MVSAASNVYFPDEMWNEIKEFAGIYHITRDWYKLAKVGAIRLNSFFKQNYRCCVPNAQANTEKTRKIIYKAIFGKPMNKEAILALYGLISPRHKIQLPAVEVGDEIIYKHDDRRSHKTQMYAGVITKIHKSSVTFKTYSILQVLQTETGFQNIGRIIYYWNKNSFNSLRTVKNFIVAKDYDGPTDYYDEFTWNGNGN
jgi:hypothetical protein